MKLLRKSQVIDVETFEPKTIEIWTRNINGELYMFCMTPGTQLELDFN